MEALLGIIGVIVGAIIGGFVTDYFSLKATKDLLAGERQNREAEKEERIKALLFVLKDEIRAVWTHYMDGTGSTLEKLPEAHAFQFYFPIVGDYFPIYNGNVTSLGLVSDVLLRHQIISTYTLAKSLIDSYRMNNQLIKEWEDATKQIYYSQHTTQAQKVANMKENALRAYAPALKELHLKTKEAVEELTDTLDMWTISESAN